MNADERTAARLLFADELAAGTVSMRDLDRPEVLRAVRARPVPPRPTRLLQALALKRGLISYERHVLRPLVAARAAVLGERAAGPPKLLVRMDEFPHARAYDEPERYGDGAFARFTEIVGGAGVPYLLAVTPRPCHDYLDPGAQGERRLTADERRLLGEATAAGAEPALHGLTHRTRRANPRGHSELAGLGPEAVAGLIDRGMAELAEAGLRPRAFVPPFNRFELDQLPMLAARFDVVCGGPESVPLVGFQRTPEGRAGTVYLPSYAPLYSVADEVEAAVRRIVQLRPGTWVPLTLHLGWEADSGWTALERLTRIVAPYARRWSELISAAAG